MNCLLIIIPFTILVFIAASIYSYTKVKAQYSFFVAFCFVSLILVVGGWLNLLLYTTIMVYTLGITCFGWCIHNKKDFVIAFFKSPSVWFLLIHCMLIIISYINRENTFTMWDEYSHWGPFFKSIFMNDALPMYVDTTLTHGSYPQIVSLFFYFLTFFVPVFSEDICFLAILIILSIAVLPMVGYGIDTEKNSPVLKIISILLGITFLVLIPELEPYSSIMHDAIIGVTFGTILIYITYEQEVPYKKAIVSAMLFTFIQIKTSALPLVAIAWGIYAVNLFFGSDFLIQNFWKNLKDIPKWRLLCSQAIGLFLLHKAWPLFYSMTGRIDYTVVAREGYISFTERWSDYTANGSASFLSQFKDIFLDGLWTQPVMGINTIMVFTILLAITSFQLIYLYKIQRYIRNELIFLPIAFVLFMFVLFIGYLTRFASGRALVLGSYYRYVTPMPLGWLMCLIVLNYKILADKKLKECVNRFIRLSSWTFLCVLALFTTVMFIKKENNNYFLHYTSDEEMEQDRYIEISAKLSEYVHSDNIVWIISQGNDGSVAFNYKYRLIGICNILEPSPKLGVPSLALSAPDTTGYYKEITRTRFESIITNYNCDYILVNYADEYLQDGYGDYFSDGVQTGHLWNAKLYAVSIENDTPLLNLLEVFY